MSSEFARVRSIPALPLRVLVLLVIPGAALAGPSLVSNSASRRCRSSFDFTLTKARISCCLTLRTMRTLSGVAVLNARIKNAMMMPRCSRARLSRKRGKCEKQGQLDIKMGRHISTSYTSDQNFAVAASNTHLVPILHDKLISGHSSRRGIISPEGARRAWAKVKLAETQ